MKIGFIYYTFYPVTNGAAVHGYNLAKELNRLGYDLYKVNGEPDPYTHKLKNRVTGLLWILRKCDLIYVRMDYFLKFRNLTTLLAVLFRKKVIVELNSPADELHLFGKGSRYIKMADRVMGFILRKVDAVIVINDIVKQYGEEVLGLSNVYAIDNGGEVFENNASRADKTTVDLLRSVKEKYGKIVVWTGSGSKMHDFGRLKKVAASLKDKAAVLILVKEEGARIPTSFELENLFVLKNLDRNDVRYIVANSDVGLTFYSSFSWSRWGYYGSSTKTYEYLNNGLLTLSNISGTEHQRKYPNFRQISDYDEAVEWIVKPGKITPDKNLIRTWENVAKETSLIIEKVTKR